MSYEGSHETLCERGHYDRRDCYSEDLRVCPVCGSPIAWRHGIDETNGYDPDEPCTYSAEKREIGFDDDWQSDHHGNRYALKVRRFAPNSKEWMRVR